MADYRKKKNEPKIPDSGSIDLDALANLIAGKVSEGIEIPKQNGIMYRGFAPDGTPLNDEAFDASASMSQLADSMIVQRGDNKSNFEDLGGVAETKKDNNETNNTIDLLADLED